MHKSDTRELKKHFMKAPNEDGVIRSVYGTYVSPTEGAVWEHVWNYSMLDDDMKHRIVQILGKAFKFSGSGSGVSADIESPSDDILDLRDTDDQDDFSDLKDMAVDYIKEDDPYCLLAAQIVYDIPKKASDGTTLEDSEDVYTGLICAICPAKLSTPALGYTNDAIEELTRRWTIKGTPEVSFIYPTFSDRSENQHEVFFIDKGAHAEFLSSLFKISSKVETKDEQKLAFGSAVEAMQLKTEEAAAFHETLNEVSLDKDTPEVLDKSTFVQAAREAGISAEKAADSFESELNGHAVQVQNIVQKKTTYQTGDAILTIPSDASESVSVKEIDGIQYLAIPVNGTVMVNGTEAVL